MRTLTKERVSPSGLSNNSGTLSMDLIGDGPNEVASQMITKFHQTNQEAALKQREVSLVVKEKDFRQNLAKGFIQHYMSIFGITKDQMRELVYGIKGENILVVEHTLVERLRKRTRALIGASIIICGAYVCEIVSAQTMPLPLMIFPIFGWILPFLVFVSLVFPMPTPIPFITYTCDRKRLKKKYGPDYFPIQELREELGLAIDAPEEK